MSDNKNILPTWEKYNKELEYNLKHKDFSDFLKWDVLIQTMFLRNNFFIIIELFYLLTHNWNMWKHVIKEDYSGNPTPYIFYKKSSGNLIHHAYHIAKFMNATKQDIRGYDTIFEFGGGYGSMARLFHNIGFDKEYVIYDNPQFSSLQQQYLKAIGKDNGIKYISDIKDIPKFEGRTLFIGTWSLSEVPIQLRDDIITKVDADSYLIAYQAFFDDIDNSLYFNNDIQQNKQIKWDNHKIKHIRGNHYYLFGVELNVNEVPYHARH